MNQRVAEANTTLIIGKNEELVWVVFESVLNLTLIQGLETIL